MRLTLLKLSALACVAILFTLPVVAQNNCIPTNLNNTTINLSCNQPCRNITFQVPHLKSSSDYNVVSVPYTPYPYLSASGIESPVIYNDDEYGDKVTLPFRFCFYDSIFSKFTVGSNGLITFDTTNAAPCKNAYTTTTPIPSAGTAGQCAQFGTYYPRAAIMAAYSDLDPRSSAQSPTNPPSPDDRKIMWFVVGNAPCRKYIVSFYHIGVFNSTCGLTTPNTFQIVLHEGTGLIEVFFEQKACYSSSGGGNAILGIQNWTRDKAVAAPGKNVARWAENNTGYAFVPSGGISNYVSSQMFTMGGTLVATADTSTSVAGLLDINFPNICPPPGNMQYRIVTSFRSCADGTLMTSEDTITISRNNALNATSSSTPSACGPPSGSITVTVPAGTGTAPYTYVLDGTTTQVTGNTVTFNNVPQGAHTVVVTDASGTCTSTLNINVAQVSGLTANVAPQATSCPGVNNGVIAVNPTNGLAPFTFTLNPAGTVQTGATANFTGLAPGSYSVLISDNSGCVTTVPISTIVGSGAGITNTSAQTATTCQGASNGTITVTPTNGSGPYTYVLDGVTTQTAPGAYTFTGVASGTHTITITDANGCTRAPALTVIVGAGAVLNATPSLTATTCSGASNGTATFTPTNGTGPYTFNLDAGAAIQTGATSTTFTGLASGIHSVVISDANGCTSNPISVAIGSGPGLSTTASHTDVLCNGASNGVITVVQPASGTAPFEYSLDGILWQTSNVFNGLPAGTYTIRYREASGCNGQLTEVVSQPTVLSATQSTVAVVCNGQSNGTITVNASGGQAPYQYSLDGVAWQATNVFNVPAGSYTVTIRDNNNCTTTQNMTVTEPTALGGSATTSDATCNGGNDGVITITANGGNGSYQYSINAGTNYQASNIFNVAPGTYTVSIKDALGCTFEVPNVVVGLINDLTYTDPADPTICEGTSTQLQVVSNALQYSWSPASGVSNAAVSNPTLNPAVTTLYTVTVTLGRCTADIPITVNVNQAPVPDAGVQGYICYGQTYQLQGSGGTSYTWTPSTYLDNPNIANPISTPDRTITYTLSVKDANNCASLVTDQITVDVTPPIKVTTYPFDTVAYDGDQFQILATSGATDYLWTPAIGLSDPTIPNPIVTTGAIGDVAVYKVTASTIAGCKGEGYVTVRVYKGPDFYVPTGFTPNGDGKNDTFYPFPVGIKEVKYFRVFNRWGQLVFQTSRLNHGWDGRLGGREQASDVYVWQVEGITKDNRVVTKKGTVVLIR